MNNKEIPFEYRYIAENIEDFIRNRDAGGSKSWFRFCSDDYSEYGCTFDTDMRKGNLKNLIKNNQIRTRVSKSKDAQKRRTTEKAEVFTPTWVCEYQVNQCIVGEPGLTKEELSIKANEIINNLTKEDNEEEYYSFINKTWLEACCGEAPYVVSRYDAVSGEDIDVKDRVGFLDRKLQLIGKRRDTFEEWYNDVKKAYKSVYAYEWQGDNLFIARCNLFMTFVDYYEDKFNRNMENLAMDEYAKDIIDIIAKNTTQMDGLTWMKPGTDDVAYLYDWGYEENNDRAKKKRYRQYYEIANGVEYTKQMTFEGF